MADGRIAFGLGPRRQRPRLAPLDEQALVDSTLADAVCADEAAERAGRDPAPTTTGSRAEMAGDTAYPIVPQPKSIDELPDAPDMAAYALRPVEGYGLSLLGTSASSGTATPGNSAPPSGRGEDAKTSFTGGRQPGTLKRVADISTSVFEGIDLPALAAEEERRRAHVTIAGGFHAGLTGSMASGSDGDTATIVLDISGATVSVPMSHVDGVAPGEAGDCPVAVDSFLLCKCPVVRIVARGKHYWRVARVRDAQGADKVRVAVEHAHGTRDVLLAAKDIAVVHPSEGDHAVYFGTAGEVPRGEICRVLEFTDTPPSSLALVQMLESGDVVVADTRHMCRVDV